jgi:hypothetical protein
MHTLHEELLAQVRRELQQYRRLAERALAQIDDEAFFRTLGPEINSPAQLVKHLGGNLRSRWRNFLTEDGEKPDRNRDGEFLIGPEDTRAALMALWQAGWGELEATLAALTPTDLGRTVHVRFEPHSVPQAMLRQLAHTAYHVGQLVQLARHACGESWQTLSVARGGSVAFNEAMRDQFGSGAP